MADMAKSETSYQDWSEQPGYVINAHSPLQDIQYGCRENFEEVELGSSLKIAKKNLYIR